MQLQELLEVIGRERGPDFLANDPLEFPRRFSGPEDREIAAFFSAVLAYGRVSIIRRNLEDLFGRMPEGPAAFVRNFEPRRDRSRLSGFRHRFNSEDDVAGLCWILKSLLQEGSTLERVFLSGDESASDIGPGLTNFCRRALSVDLSPVFGSQSPPKGSYLEYFFPAPAGGSACKRLCMFLRWVCRPDDGIDLGLWKGVSAARLVIPLDTHTARLSRLLGLSRRATPDWKMALEVTQSLRRFDPEDPVRYDFALSHLGISEGCTGKKGKVCVPCPVSGLCEVKKVGK